MGREDSRNRRSRERSLTGRRSRRSLSRSRGRRSRSRTPRGPGRCTTTKVDFHSRHSNPDRNRVIAVFGLLDDQTESDLREMFSPFGAIQLASVVLNPRTGRSRGYGFVHFRTPEEATRARQYWDGVVIGRKRIQVSYSYAQQPHRRTPGVYCKRLSHKLVNYRPSFRRSPSSESNKSGR